ncbi:MAG: hypothetical protein KKC03_13615 [Bacteroidetes bacterium]|nr:hypothetical protein [Bacteroidota bacterium]
MKFICVRKCFRGAKLHEVGDKVDSDLDLTETKEGYAPHWKKIGSDAEETTERPERMPMRDLWKMNEEDLVLHTHARFGVALEGTKTSMIDEIKLLEKSEDQKNKVLRNDDRTY